MGARLATLVYTPFRHELCEFSSRIPSFHCGGSEISYAGLHSVPARTLRVLISHTFISLRWERDSNSRYRYQYDSLANCWFKPLTHPTIVQRTGRKNKHSIEFIANFYEFFCFFLFKNRLFTESQ